MPATLEKFVQHLTDSGLMSAAEVASFQDTLPPDRKSKDAEDLARELVQAGKLTGYQAQMVAQGEVRGLVFGEYRVLDKLGQGGMGVVLKAEHRRMQRFVAVKVLPAATMKSPQAIERFYREVRAAARLNHPNIVQAHDAGEHDGIHYLVMEYVDGRDLAAVVRERGPLPVAQAVDHIVQAARGLHYAHQHGVVHRDIKPANLLLDREGTIKILDMGLARIGGMAADEDRDRLTDSGQVMGTCDYMAPEQALDAHHADRRADVYSLGCTLYRLLTGQVPYRRDSLAQIILAHQQAPVPSLCQARPDVPPQLDAVFQKMVAKQPEDRYQSMAEVIVALEAAVGRGEYVDMPTETFPGGPPDEVPVSGGVGLATAAKVRAEAEVAVGDTPTQQAAVETSRQLGPATKLLVRARQRKVLGAAIGLVLVCAAAVTAFVMFRGPQPDDGQTAGDQTAGQTWEAMYGPDAPAPAIAPFDAKKAKELQEAWAKYLGVPVEMENSIGMRFVLIPPGEFEMGSTEEDVARLLEQAKAANKPGWYIYHLAAEAPKHRVRITKPFWLGVHELTRGQFQRFVDERGYKTEAERDGKGGIGYIDGQWKQDPRFVWNRNLGFEQGDDFPVLNVSWSDVTAFCAWLSEKEGKKSHLPSEAQWEYACRAGTTTAWYLGDDEGALKEHGWFSFNSEGKTHPVGQKSPNAWGLYDMHGNVWEWCQDWCGDRYYDASPMDDPPGVPGGSRRVLRGGSWNNDASFGRVSSRYWSDPGFRNENHGFRIAMTVALPSKVSQSPKKNGNSPTPQPVAKPLPPWPLPAGSPPPAIAPFDAKKANEHQEAWAKWLGVEAEMENSVGMKFVLIPPGEFDMGSTEKEVARLLEEAKATKQPDWYIERLSSESPKHRVRITEPFWLGAHEVTRDQFRRFVDERAYRTEAERDGKGGWGLVDGEWKQEPRFVWNRDLGIEQANDHPVVNVTWNDVTAFCDWLSEKENEKSQLPTEAQWEYACRAGTTTAWYSGDDEGSLRLRGWFSFNAGGKTHPVGQKLPNAWGLYDMHGNVWEWCEDWWGDRYYVSSPTDNPTGASGGGCRVIRGGVWQESASCSRSSFRNRIAPQDRHMRQGFRIAKIVSLTSKVRQSPKKNADAPTPKPPMPQPVAKPVPPWALPPGSPPPAVAPFDAQKAKEHQEAWAKYLGMPVVIENSIGMKLVLIPPGEFDMGSTEEEQKWAMEEAKRTNDKYALESIPIEGPRHRVRITKPFWLGIHEVTQGEYEKVMSRNPSEFSESGKCREQVAGQHTSRFPVETVSWEDASRFCLSLSDLAVERTERRVYQLPTEAQWEYACRAGTRSRWSGGDDARNVEEYAWFRCNTPRPVGLKQPNAWGAYDMHGNVRELCGDWFDATHYASATGGVAIDPTGPAEGSLRINRGGGWINAAGSCRSAIRYLIDPGNRHGNLGFRVSVIPTDTSDERAKGGELFENRLTLPTGAVAIGTPSRRADKRPHPVR